MYIVIFKARIKSLDDDYYATAKRLRELAMKQYGCVDFISVLEGSQEISLSYWNDENDIVRWKQDPLHLQAQQSGRSRWYASYSVEITKSTRRYAHTQAAE